MEPQCFNLSLPPLQKCGTPPALINGYILVKDDTKPAFVLCIVE